MPGGWITVRTKEIATGEVRVVYDGENLITDNGLTMLSRLLAQQTGVPADLKITTIKFGDGSTTPAVTQTTIAGSEVENETVTATEDVAAIPGLIEFEAELDTTEGNGSTISEVALMTSNGTMFARQLIEPVAKDNTITLTANWRLQFIES